MNLPKKNLKLMEEVGSTGQPSPTDGGAAPAVATPAAPAAAPAVDSTPAAAPASDGSGPSASDLELFSESEGGDEDINISKPAATPAPTPAAPVPAAATPAAPAPAAPAPATSQPGEPQATVPAAAPAKPDVPAAETPEQKAARAAAEAVEETKMFDGLVEYYKLPDDMAAKLPTEPENVLPVMAARVHQAVAQGVRRMLNEALPAMILQTQQMQQSEQAAKSAFYKVWPQLEGYEQQVLQAGKMYRQLNPTAKSDEAIKAIGKIVADSLGITVASGVASGVAVAAAALPPAGHMPAGASGSRSAAPAAEDNEFTRMSLEQD